MAAALDSLALLWALYIYRRQILPVVGAEQRRWETRAEAIPDPVLRVAALGALREKGGNAAATAVLAILAPGPRRTTVVRAGVALQTAVDYLDSLSEQAVEDRLGDGLALHEALTDALTPEAETGDWYRFHPDSEDGGYLAELVGACRDEVGALPAAGAALPAARRAARRCGEGQSHTHAAVEDGDERLQEWAAGLGAPPGHRWWEVAAGASSSVAAHALIAAAADPSTTARDAEAIDAAYFPSTGALTVLLDDLVDLEDDRASGEHNYIGYYSDSEEAAERLSAIAAEARKVVARLPHHRRHAAILAGVVAYYLSSQPPDSAVRARMLASAGAPARLALVLISRKRLGGQGWSPSPPLAP